MWAESHHPLNTEQTEKSTTLFRFDREVGSPGPHCPQNWRNQQENAENCNLSEHKPKRINFHRNQCQGWETWTINSQIARHNSEDKSWDRKTPQGPSHQGPHTFLSLTSRNLTRISQVSIWEKSPWASHKGRGGTILKSELSILFNKACPQEKLYIQSLTCWDIIRA